MLPNHATLNLDRGWGHTSQAENIALKLERKGEERVQRARGTCSTQTITCRILELNIATG